MSTNTNSIATPNVRASDDFLVSFESSATAPTTFKQRADILLMLGIPLIPLQVKSKDPCTKHAAIDGTTDPDIIDRWIDEYPASSNCGACARFDGFWMLDDDLGTLAATYKAATGLDLPSTFTVKTSRGFHYYFIHDDASRAVRYDGHDNSSVIDIPGYKGEARCDHQYVVGPGSVHPSGAVYEICNDVPIVAAPAQLLEWLQAAYTLSESLKDKEKKPRSNRKADPGFNKLYDVVGYRPLVHRINALADVSLHSTEGLRRGKTVPCPMPQHKHSDYTACFGPLKDVPELLHCLGNCKWSGDMVAAVYQLDGGNAKYKNMYDCARAICKEENLNFEDFFPAKPAATAQQNADPCNTSGTSPTDIDFPDDPVEPEQLLPDFPSMITGSIADLVHAWEPDLPMEFKVMTLVTKIGLALSGRITLEGHENLQPRFYTTLIAPPWRGKTAVIETSGFDDRELYDTAFSLDSGPVLVRNFLARHTYLHPDALTLTADPLALLLSPDEIKDVFEKSKSSKESKDSILTKLLRMHDSNKVGNNTIRGGNMNLMTAHFAMIGGATREGYEGMWINTGGGMNGLQSRMSLVGTNNEQVPQRRRPSDQHIVAVSRDRIMAQIRGVSQGTLMPTTEEAEMVMAEWWTLQSAIPQSSRVPDIVRRLAEVYAVTNDLDTITEPIMRMAIPYGDHLIAMRVKYNPQDSTSNVQAMENRIEACYKKHGDMADRQLMLRVQPARYPGGYQAYGAAKRAMKDAGAIRSKGKVRHGQYKVDIFGL